jgi:tetratricopeptide (TPR) repeat protein
MRWWLLALSLSVAACAPTSAPPAVAPAPPVAVIGEALVRDGCYDCLLEARELYLSRADWAAPATIASRLFEVELLIALREKELALDAEAALARADALIPELSDQATAARLLRIAAMVPPDVTGTPRRAQGPPFGSRREDAVAHRDWLQLLLPAAAGADLRAYLVLSLECPLRLDPAAMDDVVADDENADAVAAPSPLVAYRSATCRRLDGPALEDVRARVPRFVETSLFLGRVAMAALRGTGGAPARRHLEEVHARFPESPTVTMVNGNLYRALGDCARAVEFYTNTLRIVETHEDARLDRAICRTYLGQPDAAVADTTRLIDEAASNRGDAYYWRAWNHRTAGDLAQARADIDRGRALLVNGPVLTLAGMIEHDQDDLDRAEADLADAIRLDAGNCIAHAYLGLVGAKREAWMASAAAFAAATECYGATARFSEDERAALVALVEDPELEMDPLFVEQQLAGFDAAIAEDRSMESRAAVNAAATYLRAGDDALARLFTERAADDPARADRVSELRRLLDDRATP